MGGLRRRLTWIAAGWLCGQLSLLAAAPISLAANTERAADATTCTCVHDGPDAYCPMHHGAAPKPDCECGSTTDPGAAAVVTLLGPIAVLADAPHPASHLTITESPDHPVARFISLTSPPDGPPPRA